MKDLFGQMLPKQKQQVYISTTTGTNSPWSHSTNIRQIMREVLEGTMWTWPPEHNLSGERVRLWHFWMEVWMWSPRAVGFSFLFSFQRSKSRMWACQDPQRINTIAVLRTYGICHLPLGKETLPWLCHHLPFLITSLSIRLSLCAPVGI